VEENLAIEVEVTNEANRSEVERAAERYMEAKSNC